MNSKQTPETMNQVLDLIRKEFPTQKELCERVGIDCKTLANWKRRNPEFTSEMEKAKREFIIKSASGPALHSMIRSIQGYIAVDEKITYVRDKRTHREKQVARIVTRREVGPNVPLLMYVLSNIYPEYFEK